MSQEAMRLALNKAFQLGQRYWSWADSEYSSHWKKADAAKSEFDQLVQNTINAALAEQPAQQEPVAWIYSHGKAKVVSMNYVPGVRATPLYTDPQPCPTCEALARTVMLDQTSHDTHCKPLVGLKDQEIVDLWTDAALKFDGSGWHAIGKQFARAIEAAHGIGQKK